MPTTDSTLVVAGAPPDTLNLGVSALGEAACTELADRCGDVPITVLDNGRGIRDAAAEYPEVRSPIELMGAMYTKRLFRPECWYRIRAAARLGGLGSPIAARIRNALAILDVSGGDSFTDLYGDWRFRLALQPKLAAMENGVPLVLLPQTYGPFRSTAARERAAEIVRAAEIAWARDTHSHEILQSLLGADFDPQRHGSGVDMAFLLRPRPPGDKLPGDVATLIESPDRAPLVGLNVSGLILNDPEATRTRFNFRADYAETVVAFSRRVLEETDATLVLVSHVLTPDGHPESDLRACKTVRAALGDAADGRVIVLPAAFDQAEIKWVIARMDWFCGTRMHSTIASLSTGVPTATVTYSPKAQGVFETCGQGGQVIDPTVLDTDDVIRRMWESLLDRDAVRTSLGQHLPDVLERADGQMSQIAAFCRRRAETRVR